ncbi:MAG: hypothetical protein EXS37_08340 [Opitutus sp.]|nr:hypothetical protein [Opitutus sp.]
MNSLVSRRRRAPRVSRPALLSSVGQTASPDLHWIHDGVRFRATAWPDVRFEREVAPGGWEAGEFEEAVFASTALGVSATQWRRFLEFVPAAERDFLTTFVFGRMAALQVIVCCPALLPELREAPALTTFLALHLSLRGGEQACWAEIAALFERDGIFGVLQWLGLPASRQTLAILHNITDPDLPRWLLEPLRAALWEPEAIWALSHTAALTDERLAETCHALAA